MKAAYLIRTGPPETAFEIREIPRPEPGAGEVLIRVEAFGLNFADVQARLGHYRGAPPLPAVIGYDVVGRIEVCGPEVEALKVGDRVTALTRFGGYAEYALTDQRAVAKIPDDMPAGVAAALSTQCCTAYYLACELANLQAGDQVLVHAAAGGVGTALVQLALHRGCTVFGTCSAPAKMTYLRQNGVHHPINYREEDFAAGVRKIVGGNGLDAIFDPVGGKSVGKGFKLLGAGGRMFTFGVSSMNQTRSIFGKIRVLWQFGIYHPVQFMMASRGMIGVNMLKIADDRPEKLERLMQAVVELAEKGVLRPHVGGTYPASQLAEAHRLLESRQSMGKVVVAW